MHAAQDYLQLGRSHMVSTCQSMHFARLSRLEMKDYAALVAAAATGASGARAHTSGSWQSACARHDQRAAAELRPMAQSGNIWKERAPEGIGKKCLLKAPRLQVATPPGDQIWTVEVLRALCSISPLGEGVRFAVVTTDVTK